MTPLFTGRTGDHDDDETERECDENDGNVADRDVRVTCYILAEQVIMMIMRERERVCDKMMVMLLMDM